MKAPLILTLLLSPLFLLSCAKRQGAGEETPKPHVILLITDDQGYGDLACHGNPWIRTPNLDQFSQEAVNFSNFHVSTTCAPTRGALLTGRHTNRLNVYHTIAGRSLLYEDEILLSQVLASADYTCGMFGKWHLGDNYPFRPGDRGFHEVLRHGGGGIGQLPDYWGNDYFDDTYWHNGQLETFEGYCTDVFFDAALQFIEENRDKPFFCYLSTNAPHSPLNLPLEYLELYREVEELPERQKRFYGMITNIDDNFRRLENKLDELGLKENTILIFMTDNGTAGGQLVYDAGLRGQKGSEYEGGHRVPLMIRWPEGGIGGGREIHELTAHFDLLPTLVDLLGLDYHSSKNLDGSSLGPLLREEKAAWKDRILFVDTQRRLDLVKYKQYAVMEQDWRLVNGDELYDLSEDLGQSRNVIDSFPEVAARLAAGYEEWWTSIMSEGVDERFARIRVGSDQENPVRICAHDLRNPSLKLWHQHGAANASTGSGSWKLEVVEAAEYEISLRRFPRESGLEINASFPAAPRPPELASSMPAAAEVAFTEASLYIGGFSATKTLDEKAEAISFRTYLSPGKYDLIAQLKDRHGRQYPAYFVYFEKLNSAH